MFSRAEAWTRFFAAVYAREGTIVYAGAVADEMLEQLDKRFEYNNTHGLWFNKGRKEPK